MTEVFGGGADGVHEALDRLVADTRAKAQRYQQMRAGVEQVSATEASPDGVVTITVNAAGMVTELCLTDRIRELTGSALASTIMSTIRRAQARLADQVADVMAATVGDDQTTMDVVLANYHARFPDPEPQATPEQRDDGDAQLMR
jgi:hypothetical protein